MTRPILKLSAVLLSDGRPAWPVAKANGVSRHTFRARLVRGWSPDAATAPVDKAARRPGRPPCPLLLAAVLSDGRPAWPVAQAAGLSRDAFRYRLKAGWPPDDAVRPAGSVNPSGPRPRASAAVAVRPVGRPRGTFPECIALADGRQALPVALANGVSRKRLRDRLICGYMADEAVKPDGRLLLSDGRPAVKVARSRGISRRELFRRIRSGIDPDKAVL